MFCIAGDFNLNVIDHVKNTEFSKFIVPELGI